MPVFFGEKLADSHHYLKLSQAEYNGLVKGVNHSLSIDLLKDVMFLDVQTGNPIPPVNDTSFVNIVSPKTTTIRGLPLNLPAKTVTRTRSALDQYRSSPVTWRTPHSTKLDTDAIRYTQSYRSQITGLIIACRYYREHHSYFNSGAERSKGRRELSSVQSAR